MLGRLRQTRMFLRSRFCAYQGTRLPIVRSDNFGRLPFSGQLSGKQAA